jgi:hypothetical protein
MIQTGALYAVYNYCLAGFFFLNKSIGFGGGGGGAGVLLSALATLSLLFFWAFLSFLKGFILLNTSLGDGGGGRAAPGFGGSCAAAV